MLASILRYGFHFGMARLLTPAEYGILGVGEGLLAIMMLFSLLGFPWTVTRSLAAGRHDVFKAALLGNLLLAGLISLALGLAFKLGITSLGAGYAPIVTIIAGALLVSAVGGVYGGALRGVFRFRQVAVSGACQALVLVAVGFALVLLGAGPSGAIGGYAAGILAAALVSMYFLRGAGVWRGPWIRRDVYAVTLPLLLGILGTQLLVNIDILGIKLLSPESSDAMAGYYKAVLVPARMPVFLVTAMMGAFFPFMSRYAAAREAVAVYSSRMIKYILIFILPMYVALFTIPTSIITLVFPDAYAAGGDALRIMSVGMMSLALVTVLATGFQATGRQKLVAAVLSLSVALQLALLTLLIPRYGLSGAAAATTVSGAFALSALLFKYTRDYKPNVSLSSAAILVGACVVQGVLLALFPVGNRLLIAVGVGLSYALYILILTVLRILDSEDVRGILSGVLPADSKLLRWAVEATARLNRLGARRQS